MKILLSFLIFIMTACNSIYGDSSAMMNTLNNYVNLRINKLPLTITMNDLNSNEKYYNLSSALTTKSERVGSIKRGDFMLYGNNCLVLFYESFSTSYSYTKIGYIENTDGLKDSLGMGSIEITFSAN